MSRPAKQKTDAKRAPEEKKAEVDAPREHVVPSARPPVMLQTFDPPCAAYPPVVQAFYAARLRRVAQTARLLT